MRRLLACRCTMGEAKIIRPTCGNTAHPAAAWCSNSGWVAGVKVRSSSWDSLKAFCKATRYTLSLWPKLVRFLEYPEVELSNNVAENSMRPLVLGRKNWIHLGSQQAGPKVAAILSIFESCRRLKIPIRDYLADVLPGLAAFPMHRITELTPAVWATR